MEDGRFADALDRHLWIHQESLKYVSGFSGVRLSYALAQWVELGKRYPPALDALKAIRDEAEKRARERAVAWDAFHDAASINATLGEPSRTAALFEWIDAERPEIAKSVYPLAQNSLVATRKYRLAGKYLDAGEVDRIIGMYQLNRRMDSRNPGMTKFARDSFTNRAAMLVGLLAVNGRDAEAQAAMQAFLKEWPEEVPRDMLDSAARGVVPEPWPRNG